MKKYFGWIMAIVLIFAMTGCGNGVDTTSGTNADGSQVSPFSNTGGGNAGSQANQSTAPGANSSSSSASSSDGKQETTSTTTVSANQGSFVESTINAAEEYVLVTAYDSSRNENHYKYVDRKALIRFINSRGTDGYFDYFDLMHNVGYAVPFDFIYAAPFDHNNRAIVRMADANGVIKDCVIDPLGNIVIGANEDFTHIISTDEDYLALEQISNDKPYTETEYVGVLYDKVGRELARIPVIGSAHYESGRIVSKTGEYDAKTLAPLSPAEFRVQDYYSWYEYLGDGYYAVADLTVHPTDLQHYLKQDKNSFKKALWKEGMTLTTFDSWIIKGVKPYGKGVFYFSNGTKNYIVNVEAGEKYDQFNLGTRVEEKNAVLYPGLLVSSMGGESSDYRTDVDIALGNWVLQTNGIPTYYLMQQDKTHYMRIGQVILQDYGIAESINRGIVEIMKDRLKNPNVSGDVVLSRRYITADPSIHQNVLTFDERIHVNDYGSPETDDMNFHNFNLKTGDLIAFEDWFDDPESAKSAFMTWIYDFFLDYRPGHFENTSDLDGAFLYDYWDQMLEPTRAYEYGFNMYYAPSVFGMEETDLIKVHIPKEVFEAYLKPEYQDFFDGNQ